MVRQITISDQTFARLQALAQPLVDEPEDVIRRLLDQGTPVQAKSEWTSMSASTLSRVPRERGVTVKIGNTTIQATSVSDLYANALRLFVGEHKSKLDTLVPFKTSNRRYLIASKPVHPTGKHFVVPIEYRGLHMEAHKDYKNAIEHLRKLAARLGLTLTYVS